MCCNILYMYIYYTCIYTIHVYILYMYCIYIPIRAKKVQYEKKRKKCMPFSGVAYWTIYTHTVKYVKYISHIRLYIYTQSNEKSSPIQEEKKKKCMLSSGVWRIGQTIYIYVYVSIYMIHYGKKIQYLF